MNGQRKPPSFVEAERARGRRAKVLAPLAAERKAQAPGRPQGAKVSSPKLGEEKPDARTAKIAAVGTGYSGSTLDKVTDVREKAEDESLARARKRITAFGVVGVRTRGQRWALAAVLRGRPPPSARDKVKLMEQGKVTALDLTAGVGGINPDDKTEELPFLTSSVQEARSMKPEQRVRYEVVWGAKGPEATDVQPL